MALWESATHPQVRQWLFIHYHMDCICSHLIVVYSVNIYWPLSQHPAQSLSWVDKSQFLSSGILADQMFKYMKSSVNKYLLSNCCVPSTVVGYRGNTWRALTNVECLPSVGGVYLQCHCPPHTSSGLTFTVSAGPVPSGQLELSPWSFLRVLETALTHPSRKPEVLGNLCPILWNCHQLVTDSSWCKSNPAPSPPQVR